MARPRRFGNAGRAGVDTAFGAYLAEGGAVRGLVVNPEHIVHVLVRHLVFQDLDQHAPTMIGQEAPRELEAARRRYEASETPVRVGEFEHGGRELAAKQRRVEFLVVAPRRVERPPLELNAERRVPVFRSRVHPRTMGPFRSER